MLLQLDAELLHAEINASGGYRVLKERVPSAPDRTTVYRWRTGGTMPALERRVVDLAMALRIDPLAIVHVEDANFARICDEAFRAIRSSIVPGMAGKMRRKLSPFAYVLDFVSAASEWPPRVLVGIAIPWRTFAFSHRAVERRNYYATIVLEPLERPHVAPCLFHFAWRTGDGFAWRPYGFVKVWTDRIELYAFSGAFEYREIQPGKSTGVETRFGEGPADFLVASIHRFTAHVLDEPAPNITSVQFA